MRALLRRDSRIVEIAQKRLLCDRPEVSIGGDGNVVNSNVSRLLPVELYHYKLGNAHRSLFGSDTIADMSRFGCASRAREADRGDRAAKAAATLRGERRGCVVS